MQLYLFSLLPFFSLVHLGASPLRVILIKAVFFKVNFIASSTKMNDMCNTCLGRRVSSRSSEFTGSPLTLFSPVFPRFVWPWNPFSTKYQFTSYRNSTQPFGKSCCDMYFVYTHTYPLAALKAISVNELSIRFSWV